MIEFFFKNAHNIYGTTVSPDLPFSEGANTRGNTYKLHNHSFHYDVRKHSVFAHIVNINSLPNLVVDAGTANAFKARLISFDSIRLLNLTVQPI